MILYFASASSLVQSNIIESYSPAVQLGLYSNAILYLEKNIVPSSSKQVIAWTGITNCLKLKLPISDKQLTQLPIFI